MKSVRLGAEVERRLAAAAEREGVNESELIRRALERYCDAQEATVQGFDGLLEIIGTWERDDVASEGAQPLRTAVARNAHRLYGESIRANLRRPSPAAEQRAGHKTDGPPD